MTRFSKYLMFVGGLLIGSISTQNLVHAESRGKLLYSTHCINCHTTEMHWRDKKAATDWKGLQFQVQRWQKNSNLNWSEDDVQDVTRYLNETFYRYTETSDSLTLRGWSVDDLRTASRPER